MITILIQQLMDEHHHVPLMEDIFAQEEQLHLKTLAHYVPQDLFLILEKILEFLYEETVSELELKNVMMETLAI